MPKLSLTLSDGRHITQNGGLTKIDVPNNDGGGTAAAPVITGGQMYTENNAIETDLTTPALGTLVPIAGVTLLGAGTSLVSMPADGELQFDGQFGGLTHLVATVSMTSDVNQQNIRIALLHNGVVIPGTSATRRVANGSDIGNASICGAAPLGPGDTIQVAFANDTTQSNATAVFYNLVMVLIPL